MKEKTIQRVLDWGAEKGLFAQDFSAKQYLKLLEETKELVDEWEKYPRDFEKIELELGDVCFVIIILLCQLYYNEYQKGISLEHPMKRLKKLFKVKKNENLRSMAIALMYAVISLSKTIQKGITSDEFSTIVELLYDFAYTFNIDLDEALQKVCAKNEARKGQTIDGNFIKE